MTRGDGCPSDSGAAVPAEAATAETCDVDDGASDADASRETSVASTGEHADRVSTGELPLF